MPSSNVPLSPHPLHKGSRKGLVIGLGVLTIVAAVAIFLWFRVPKQTPAEVSQGLPPGATLLVGADISRIVQNEWVRRWLELPLVRMAVSVAGSRVGVDLMRLQTVAGGVWIIEGQPLILVEIQGEFNNERVAQVLKAMAADTRNISGRPFHRVESLSFLWDQDAESTDTSEANEPPHAGDGEIEWVVGQADERTLIAGAARLVVLYLDGGHTSHTDGPAEAMLKHVGDSAEMWAVGSTSQLGEMTEDLALGGLRDGKFAATVQVRDQLRLKSVVALLNEDMAGIFAASLKSEAGMAALVEALPLGLGDHGLIPQVKRTGKMVEIRLTVPLPSLQSL